MQVDRHVERLGALVDRPELLQIQELALAGEPVQHRAFEAEPSHRALELVGRGRRIRGGQLREGGEFFRMLFHDLAQPVIGLARERHGDLRCHALQGWRAVREHLEVDPCFVHLAQPQLAEVEEPFLQARIAHLEAALAEMRRDLPIPVVLLERDDHRFSSLIFQTEILFCDIGSSASRRACRPDARSGRRRRRSA
jgi:hypothetical protein